MNEFNLYNSHDKDDEFLPATVKMQTTSKAFSHGIFLCAMGLLYTSAHRIFLLEESYETIQ